MVGLMLEDARMKILGDEIQLLAVASQCFNPHFLEARHQTPKIGDTEASFPLLDRLAIKGGYNWIYQDGQRHRRIIRISRIVANFQHRQSQRQMNLRPRQTHPNILVHGLDHVVDQPLELRTAYLLCPDRLGFGPDYGMAQARNFQNHLFPPRLRYTPALRLRLIDRAWLIEPSFEKRTIRAIRATIKLGASWSLT